MPSLRSQIVTRRSYNRPLNAEGTVFETWPQTVARVIRHQRWLWEAAKREALGAKDEEELNALEALMLNREGSVSGRTLWLGGTEIARTRPVSNFNCFSRDTRFITAAGVKSFFDFEDGDTTMVWTHTGQWKPAIVREYGTQLTNTVTLARANNRTDVKATADHRWLLANGVETTQLKVGDVIRAPLTDFNEWSWDSATVEEQTYWCYGFVYGDGTKTNHGRDSMVRLCGVKNRFVSRFTDLGFKISYPPSAKGDAFAYTTGYPKALPNIVEDGPDLVKAFVRGYLDADGAKNAGAGWAVASAPFVSIQTSDPEAVEFIRNVFPSVGVFITSERAVVGDTNYGARKAGTTSFRVNTGFGQSGNSLFSVKSITPSDEEAVWCLEVEDDHSFTLPNGVVTGNCTGSLVKTVYDVVDIAWLLLNGSGVGFTPVTGVLNGFCKPIPNVQIIRSTRTMKGGAENNTETWLHDSKTWIIQVGDSAKAWAKALGKLVGGKHPAETLIIDLSQIRPAGDRLKGYGWISSGDTQLAAAMRGIADVLNQAAGRLLTAIDILDVVNWMGTILSSRRSAELAMLPSTHAQWEDFALAKRDHFEDNPQRAQSNNSLIFHKKPSREQLERVFALMVEAGGSEPGIVNGTEALRRAPDFAVLNPCVTGDTPILTSTGYRPIKETVGETVLVWNGEQWSEVEPFSTGVNPVLRVELSDGSELNCTPNHKWLILDGPSTQMGVERRHETQCLRVGDKLSEYPIPGQPPLGSPRTIVAITPCEEEETFCFTEPLAHRGTFNGIVTGQCGESLLGDKSLCNLVEVNLSAFNGRFDALREAVYTLARANYRQTVVDLRDGILQETWHELNQYLRLCGVGLTGYAQWEFQDDSDALADLYRAVRRGTDSMAEELDLPYSKRVSLVKPSGTLSKVFDCTEGVHKPLGKYIFNNVNFSASDPLVATLQAAGYHSFVNPYDPTGVVVRLPVCWDNVAFEQVNGMWVNTESAVAQLERYRLLMDCYVDHNVSITVSYDPSEIPQIVDWLETHWDQYVSAAFLPRNDPTKTASDLGYPYLPQEVVTQAVYEKYVATLKPVSLRSSDSFAELEDDCATGACPVR